ncbi:TetR-like C-terminal domain-containing protein [Devosia sp.]
MSIAARVGARAAGTPPLANQSVMSLAVKRRILPDLHAEMQRNPALAGGVRSRVQIERRQRSAAILQRAIARDELPGDVDIELFNDAGAGVLYWRMIITRDRAGSDFVEALTHFIIAGLQKS